MIMNQELIPVYGFYITHNRIREGQNSIIGRTPRDPLEEMSISFYEQLKITAKTFAMAAYHTAAIIIPLMAAAKGIQKIIE